MQAHSQMVLPPPAIDIKAMIPEELMKEIQEGQSQAVAAPVSYTHLDVYKRQDLYSVYTSRANPSLASMI